jgi:hypothetical protein
VLSWRAFISTTLADLKNPQTLLNLKRSMRQTPVGGELLADGTRRLVAGKSTRNEEHDADDQHDGGDGSHAASGVAVRLRLKRKRFDVEEESTQVDGSRLDAFAPVPDAVVGDTTASADGDAAAPSGASSSATFTVNGRVIPGLTADATVEQRAAAMRKYAVAAMEQQHALDLAEIQESQHRRSVRKAQKEQKNLRFQQRSKSASGIRR